jgi:5-methylcytosine-specific restriction enzyme A
MLNAFFANGIYESVLNEIIESQKLWPEIISYLQPYKSSTIRYLKATEPSKENPITMYISTTKNLNQISYVAEIIRWEDKRELFIKDSERIKELNSHIKQFQPGEDNIYRFYNNAECVNLISIRHLRKLDIPFHISNLIKAKNGEPYKPREMSGGWSEVYPVENIENPLFVEDIDNDLNYQIAFSRVSPKERKERLEKAKKIPDQIQIISRGFKRNADVITEVLDRANGICEKCNKKAPFIKKKDNTPYLEVHHKKTLADGGEDTVENAMAVCPNCHRELHFGL